jgi:hypothetical protein
VSDRLVNLTGHPLHFYQGGKVIRTLPSEGMYRLPQTDLPAIEVDGIEMVSVLVDKSGDLPAQEPGVWLIVSQVAALGLAAMGQRRSDVLFPGPGVSDRGRVVGCRGLRQIETL